MGNATRARAAIESATDTTWSEAAQAAYSRLEAQLSNGDPDHPLLIDARRGIARLAGRDAGRVLPVPPPPPR